MLEIIESCGEVQEMETEQALECAVRAGRSAGAHHLFFVLDSISRSDLHDTNALRQVRKLQHTKLMGHVCPHVHGGAKLAVAFDTAAKRIHVCRGRHASH